MLQHVVTLFLASLHFSVAPKIIMPDVVTAKAGSKLKIEALISGKPAPVCKWMQGNEDLVTSDRLSLQKSPNCCLLFIKDVSRMDSGYYSLSAENSTGKVNQILRVIIMGKAPFKASVLMESSMLIMVVMSVVNYCPFVHQISLVLQNHHLRLVMWILMDARFPGTHLVKMVGATSLTMLLRSVM